MTPHDWLNSENTVKRSKKPYAHFDLRTDIGKQKFYISNPHKVAAHGFYPFIHYQIKTIKFNKTKGPRVKTRDICYAAHIDRCIYQYYSFMLNELYNERVRIDGTSDVAVAYRTDLHKSNIYFSKRAFDYIKELGRCYVMIGDFTHFFDNLDHDYLKRQWCSLLKCDRLPDDHYSVFKNVTAYSKWELTDLLALNGLSDDWAGRKNLNSQVRVLMPRQFKENRSHIVKNANHYGIPQGSPISATLANVYMLEVDKLINDMILGLGGKYMRYSDDFIIILPDVAELNAAEAFGKIHTLLKTAPRLTLEQSKTQYFHYADGEKIAENSFMRKQMAAVDSSISLVLHLTADKSQSGRKQFRNIITVCTGKQITLPRLVVIHLRGSISVVKTCIDATQNAGLMENPEIS